LKSNGLEERANNNVETIDVKESTIVEEEKLQEIREIINSELKEISINKVEELKPTTNTNTVFKIELIDPNQKPIKNKCRPLPYHLKDKVKKALDEQEKAGIIQRYNS